MAGAARQRSALRARSGPRTRRALRLARGDGVRNAARFVPQLKDLAALFARPGLTPAGTSLQLRVCLRAGIAQLVERNLAKVEVGSSSLLSRSSKSNPATSSVRDKTRAKWQSGHAAACKAVYAGSIPTLASNTSLWEQPWHPASNQGGRKSQPQWGARAFRYQHPVVDERRDYAAGFQPDFEYRLDTGVRAWGSLDRTAELIPARTFLHASLDSDLKPPTVFRGSLGAVALEA
jgi:hypothetical protein